MLHSEHAQSFAVLTAGMDTRYYCHSAEDWPKHRLSIAGTVYLALFEVHISVSFFLGFMGFHGDNLRRRQVHNTRQEETEWTVAKSRFSEFLHSQHLKPWNELRIWAFGFTSWILF